LEIISYAPRRAYVVIGEGGEVDLNGMKVTFFDIVRLREILESLK
jgi:hypothetical protein